MKNLINSKITFVLAAFLAFFLMIFFTVNNMDNSHQKNTSYGIEFSEESALEHVKDIAVKSHPRGSEEHRRVWKYIVGKIKEFGLEPVIQKCEYKDEYLISRPTELTNVMTRINGTNSTGALLIMSHYDSSSQGPGASDDGMAVASMLECIKIIKQDSSFTNDIIFLFTDGEEEYLLGAERFLKEHSWMKDVRFVMNFEARGTSGPVLMFETTKGDLASIREFGKLENKTISNSLLKELYSILPNDTDFTHFRNAGIQGLNFAFIGKGYHYHTQNDSIENIDMDTFRQQGEIMLSGIRHFGALDLGKLESGSDAVYFNVFKNLYIIYPESLAVIFCIVSILIFVGAMCFGIKRKYLNLRDTVISLFLQATLCAGIFFLIPLIQKLLGLLSIDLARKLSSHIYSSNGIHSGFILLALAVITALYTIPGKWIKPQNIFAGNILLWAVITVLVTIFLPSGNYLFTWLTIGEALVLTIIIILYSNKTQNEDLNAGLLSSIPVILSIPLYLPVLILAGEGLGAAMFNYTAVIAVLIYGFIAAFFSRQSRRGIISAIIIFSVGLAFIAVDQLKPEVNINDPRINLTGSSESRVRYIYDRTKKTSKWAISDEDVYQCIKKFDKDTYRSEYIDYGPLSFIKEAPYIMLPGPSVKLTGDRKDGGKRVLEIEIKTVHPNSKFYIMLDNSNKNISKVTIDGEYSFITANRENIDITGSDSITLLMSVNSEAVPLDLRYMELIEDKSYIEGTDFIKTIEPISDYLQYRVVIHDSFKF